MGAALQHRQRGPARSESAVDSSVPSRVVFPERSRRVIPDRRRPFPGRDIKPALFQIGWHFTPSTVCSGSAPCDYILGVIQVRYTISLDTYPRNLEVPRRSGVALELRAGSQLIELGVTTSEARHVPFQSRLAVASHARTCFPISVVFTVPLSLPPAPHCSFVSSLDEPLFLQPGPVCFRKRCEYVAAVSATHRNAHCSMYPLLAMLAYSSSAAPRFEV